MPAEKTNLIKEADLAEVLRRRREGCAEFESQPAAGTSAAASGVDGAEAQADAALGASGPRSSTVRSSADLAEVLRRRREGCAEFESQPGDSVADAASAVADRRASSDEDAGAADVQSTEARAGTAEGAAMLGLSSRSAPSVEPRRPSHRARTSDEEFHSWLAKMRGRCTVLESTPQSTVADALWNQQAGGSTPSDATVLESKPAGSVADARWEAGAGSPSSRSLATGSVGGAKKEIEGRGPAAPLLPQMPFSPEPRTKRPSAATTACNGGRNEDTDRPPGAAETAQPSLGPDSKLEGAPSEEVPLPPELRHEAWSQQLQSEAGARRAHLRAESGVVAAIAARLAAGRAGAAPTAEDKQLAAVFVDKHCSWLDAPPDGNTSGDIAPAFDMLAQLLRYHSPPAAVAIQGLTQDLPLGRVLHRCCGGHTGLLRLLLGAPSEAEAAVYLLDCAALGEHETLLLFVAATLMIQVSWPRAGSPEDCAELLRKEFDTHLRGAGTSNARAATAASVEQARDLHEATPLSLHSRLACLALSAHGAARPSILTLPVCFISPDEVLRHVYERPTGSWRLVVVDIRRQRSTSALPVCMRLGANQDRREFLQGLPYGAAIHLCLLGDRTPSPGEEAFELCRFMLSEKVLRSHVSVAEGGWPIIEEFVRSAGLELMPVEPDDQDEPPTGSPAAANTSGHEKSGGAAESTSEADSNARGAKHQGKAALSAVAGVAERVATATDRAADKVSSAGQKVAQKMSAAANRALARLNKEIGGDGGGNDGGNVGSSLSGLTVL